MSYRPVRYLMALLLIAAGLLKLPDAIRVPSYFGSSQIAAEFLLGIWLLLNIWPRVTRWVCIFVFTCFLIFTFNRAWSGYPTCGCFGEISVSPWVTAFLDGSVIGVLLVSRPSEQRNPSKRGRLIALGSICLLLVAGSGSLLFFALDNKDGRELYVFDPSLGIGKTLPLLEYVDAGENLQKGNWLILLHRVDCLECQQARRRCEEWAYRDSSDLNDRRLAVVEVPGDSGQTKQLEPDRSRVIYGRLTDAKIWTLSTPLLISLQDGVLVSVHGNTEEAFAPLQIGFTGTDK